MALIKRDELMKKINGDFTARDPFYATKKGNRATRWGDLRSKIDPARQPVSMQMLLEASWLIKYSDDWTRADSILDRVAAAGDHPQPDLEQIDDGSWGPGYTEPFQLLEPTVDVLQRDTVLAQPDKLKPLAFMKKYEDPAFVVAYLDSLRVSRVRQSGRNNRVELGAVMTALSQLIFKRKLRNAFLDCPKLDFHISAELEAAYIDYLWRMQNSETGYWGPSYDFAGNHVDVHDLSFTFHVVHYFEDGFDDDERKAPNLPVIARTTLDTFDYQYPNGWRPGKPTDLPLFSDHHNYDAATLLLCAWGTMDEALRQAARPKLQSILDWCLTTSLQVDRFAPSDMTGVESYYYGVKFLNVIGFWHPPQAFWPVGPLKVPQGTPAPEVVARRLLDRFRQLGIDDHSEAADTTKEVLNAALGGQPLNLRL